MRCTAAAWWRKSPLYSSHRHSQAIVGCAPCTRSDCDRRPRRICTQAGNAASPRRENHTRKGTVRAIVASTRSMGCVTQRPDSRACTLGGPSIHDAISHRGAVQTCSTQFMKQLCPKFCRPRRPRSAGGVVAAMAPVGVSSPRGEVRRTLAGRCAIQLDAVGLTTLHGLRGRSSLVERDGWVGAQEVHTQ